MKANELRNLTTAEIEQKIAGFKEELFNLRFQLATGQLITLLVSALCVNKLHVLKQ